MDTRCERLVEKRSSIPPLSGEGRKGLVIRKKDGDETRHACRDEYAQSQGWESNEGEERFDVGKTLVER